MIDVNPLRSENEIILWLELLKASQFIYPAKQRFLDKVVPEVIATATKIINSPRPSVSTTFLARMSGKPCGTITLTRLSNSSWLIHQFATHAAYRRTKVSAKLVDIAVDSLLSSKADGCVVFYSKEKDNVSRFYTRLLLRLSGLGANIADMRVVEMWEAVDIEDVSRRENNKNIIMLSPGDVKAARLASSNSEIVNRACALGSYLPEFEIARQEYERLSLPRDRRVISDIEHDAAVLIDRFPPGLNLSGLLDSFRVFPGQTPHSAVLSIVSAAKQYSKRMGHRSIFALIEKGVMDLSPAGFRYLRDYVQLSFDMHLVLHRKEFAGSAFPFRSRTRRED